MKAPFRLATIGQTDLAHSAAQPPGERRQAERDEKANHRCHFHGFYQQQANGESVPSANRIDLLGSAVSLRQLSRQNDVEWQDFKFIPCAVSQNERVGDSFVTGSYCLCQDLTGSGHRFLPRRSHVRQIPPPLDRL
jgi:hypothetical protein